MGITIRQATPDDMDAIYNIIHGLSVYRETPPENAPTVDEIRRSLFSSEMRSEAYICEIDEVIAGYAVISLNYSTWTGRHSLNMEDMYFTPDYRGRGAGKAMLHHIAQLAVSRRCSRIEWNVLEWDKSGRDFYQSIHALPLNEWVRYRLDGPALEFFASRESI